MFPQNDQYIPICLPFLNVTLAHLLTGKVYVSSLKSGWVCDCGCSDATWLLRSGLKRWYGYFLVFLWCLLLGASCQAVRKPEQPREEPMWKGAEVHGLLPQPHFQMIAVRLCWPCEWAILKVDLPAHRVDLDSARAAESQESRDKRLLPSCRLMSKMNDYYWSKPLSFRWFVRQQQ